MFPDTFDQVTGHAYVQRTVTVAGENIDTRKFRSHARTLLDSRLRGNDGCKKMAFMSKNLTKLLITPTYNVPLRSLAGIQPLVIPAKAGIQHKKNRFTHHMPL